MKKLIVFDLDGTLAPSKSSLDSGMASLQANFIYKRAGTFIDPAEN